MDAIHTHSLVDTATRSATGSVSFTRAMASPVAAVPKGCLAM
jgi:hypothetical protein